MTLKRKITKRGSAGPFSVGRDIGTVRVRLIPAMLEGLNTSSEQIRFVSKGGAGTVPATLEHNQKQRVSAGPFVVRRYIGAEWYQRR